MDENTWEIPKERWGAYLASIQAVNRDHPVRVELVGPEVGDQTLTRMAKLRGISLAEKGSSQGALELDLGLNGGVDHRVLEPVHLYARTTPSGELACLDIEDSGDTKTLIYFERPLLLRE